MKSPGRVAAWIVALLTSHGLAADLTLASPLTFGVSGANNSAASTAAEVVIFNVSGTTVSVTLMDTPAVEARGKSEALTAVFSSLSSAPPTTGKTEAAYEGYHDSATCDAISGWVWDRNRPDTPIAVSIAADETPLLTVTADQLRRDLLDAHTGNGKHGFTSPLPPALRDGKPHWIWVTVVGSDFALAKTPQEITCAPSPGPQ